MTKARIEGCLFGGQPQLDEGRIKQYMRKIKSGEQLPAPVLFVREDGSYGVVEGRHRLEALRRCGVERIRGYYLVALPPDKIKELRSDLIQRLNEDAGR